MEIELTPKDAVDNHSAFRSSESGAALRSRWSIRSKVISVVGIVAVSAICYFIYRQLTYVSTDNATVQAHTLMISPRVGGLVEKVLVDDNQKVSAGQILVILDQRDMQNQLNQIQAELDSIKARADDAQITFRRISSLYGKAAVSKQQFDNASASLKETANKVAALEAQVEQAKLNLSYTEIKAPYDGTIAKKSVEPGMNVSMGQPLFGFIETKQRWVVANFKETELKGITPGKAANISVDAIPGRTFGGIVDSLSPSTGATFTLLPPDNATGNFTKVVQRVPVKINLVNLTDADRDALHTGLSADVTIRIR